MPAIHRLSKALQHKIAAGEVIERPASVVKELIENALDAESGFIEIELQGGGIDKIRVSDDGHGIAAEDVPLALERYATSKILEESDLFEIHSLGFRGEALASIAAVSELSLKTKPADSLSGIELIARGGELSEPQPTGLAGGTAVTVRQLFFNTPVRKKYLKSVNTEYRHCLGVIEDTALAHYQVGFRIIHNDRVTANWPATESWRERVRQVLGHEVADPLLPIDYGMAPYHIRGFVGRPDQSRSNRKAQYLYVDGRRIDDYLIHYRIREAYGTLLDRHQYPLFFLNLEVPPELVDVNVHPRKAEVKFVTPGALYSLIQTGISMSLQAHDLIPRVQPDQLKKTAAGAGYTPTFTAGAAETASNAYPLRAATSSASPSLLTKAESDELDTLFAQSTQAEPAPRLTQETALEPLVQLYATYIVARRNEEIYLIDQHAAQERTMFERLQGLQLEQTSAQPLLMPTTLELSARQMTALAPLKPLLNALGMEVDPIGPDAVIIRSLPLVLAQANPSQLLIGMIDAVLEEKNPDTLETAVREKVVMRACKISIKANETLDRSQMQKVLNDLLACEQPHTCPHGRPTMVRLDKLTLEKLFGRRA